MSERPITPRSEVPVENTWDLSCLFANEQEFLAECDAVMEIAQRAASFTGRLASSARVLLDYLLLEDETELRVGRILGYASCLADQDTGDNHSKELKGRSLGVMTTLMGALAFATPEIMAIPEDVIARFFAEEPDLAPYRRPIEKIRRRAAHILSPECETLLAQAQEIAEGPTDIAGTLRNAELRFPDVADAAGKLHALTNSSLVPLLMSGDRVLHKNAFEAYYAGLGNVKNTLSGALNAQFKQLLFFSRARKYASTLEASLDETEVPTAVYHSLIDAVHDNLDAMYRYVALRKRLLGVDELHMYDVYTPVFAASGEDIPFEQAKATVIEALGVLGKDYTDLLQTAFDNRWIDVYENIGKRSGAYSSGIARPHPFVLLNYKDNLDSQFTLAHEMGHTLHSVYSKDNQPVCTSDYVIFVAEVASTCNEVLMMRYLLKHTTDKATRIALLNHFLDSIKGTIYRQTMFAEFELMMGKMVEDGQTLTSDALCKAYHDLNALYFGPDMISDEEIGLEWARIPHFYYNYYVFQYATGYSAAVAIADRILNEGEPAVRDYKRFLSSGSSTDPISLLKIAGVDMSSPAPVNAALKLFGECVDELEKLTRE